MTPQEWLQWAVSDAERRGLPDLGPLLDQLARAIHTLRMANFSGRADADFAPDRDDDD
jgi:hypothetical protein